jgi:hypothetical protein
LEEDPSPVGDREESETVTCTFVLSMGEVGSAGSGTDCVCPKEGQEPRASVVRGSRASPASSLALERRHVDREAVLHVRFHEPVVGLVDALDGDDLDVRGDAVLAAEVEHLLGLRDAADE